MGDVQAVAYVELLPCSLRCPWNKHLFLCLLQLSVELERSEGFVGNFTLMLNARLFSYWVFLSLRRTLTPVVSSLHSP